MRGVAAVAVVVGHASHAITGLSLNPNVFLAVPFFFTLSGFVLSYAYDGSLHSPGRRIRFVVQRIIRLGPMIVPPAILGSAFLLYEARAGDLGDVPGYQIVIAQVLSFTTLPTPFVRIGAFRWPVNPPEWSLFWELMANGLFVLMLTRSRPRVLAAIAAVGMAACIAAGYRSGSLGVGLGGQMAVTLFSFTLGCLLFRAYQWRGGVPSIVGWACVVVLVAILYMPFEIDIVWHGLILGVIVPFALLTAAGYPLTGFARSVADYMGELSYPLYISHWPVMMWLKVLLPGLGVASFVAVALAACCVLSHGALVFYDRTVRRKLRELAAARMSSAPQRSF